METTTIEREAEKRAKAAGVPAEVILPTIREQFEKRPFQIEYGELHNLNVAEVTFIELDAEHDPVIRVTFNLRHAWVTDMMLSKHTTSASRAAIEVVLCTIFGARHGLTDDEKRFYTRMMGEVSTRLQHGIECLFAPGKDGLDMFGNDPNADDEE